MKINDGDVSIYIALFQTIQELLKMLKPEKGRLSFQSPFWKPSGTIITPISKRPIINSPILILKEILKRAKNSVTKAAPTTIGKVFRIIFAINHLLPSLIKSFITHILNTVKNSLVNDTKMFNLFSLNDTNLPAGRQGRSDLFLSFGGERR